MCTPKTKIKNHNESYWKHSKPFNSNTTLFLLEHVHWDNKAKTHINIKGSLNSFISDEIRRVCSQFQLPFKQNRILPEPRDNWKGSSMLGMGRFEVSLLPKLHPPQVLLAAYESQPLNPLKPEWLVLVFLPTFFHPCSNLASVKGEEILILQGSIKNSATYRSISSSGPSSNSCCGYSRNR